jgi:hypothetical protein
MWIIRRNAVSDEQQDSIQQLENHFKVLWNGVFDIYKQMGGI